MTGALCAYDDRLNPRPYNSIIPGTETSDCIDGTHPNPLPHTTPWLDVAHAYDYFKLPHPSSVPHHNEFNHLSEYTHPSYSLLPVGCEPSDGALTARGNLGFALHDQWHSFYPLSDPLPNAICNVSPPTLRRPGSDQTLANFSCRQPLWTPGDVQVDPVNEVTSAPTNRDHPGFLFSNSPPSTHPNSDNISEPYGGTLDASYPCLWMEGGVICNVMVQATRSQVNRHLHAYHEFGGPDTRQTRCYWAGCEATMQQGSIARHMVTCHLQAKVTCPMCFKKLSRQDVIPKHQRVCPAAGSLR